MIERHQICSDGVICLRIIAHYIEVGSKETSYISRVSSISDSTGVSVSLADVGVGRGIILIVGWVAVALVFQHTYLGAISACGVGVPFDAEAMGFII